MAAGQARLRDVARGWRWGARPLVPASAEAHRPPPEPASEFSTAWARTPLAVGVRAAVQAGGLKPLVWSEVSPQVRGLDNLVGLTGPVIFTANHSSHLDAPLILCSLPSAWRRRTLVTAAADYFFDAWWRATGTALAFGTVPLDRQAKTASSSSTPRELLDTGWNLVIFPEGTRSQDGQIGSFKSGTARLAMSAGVPIVPIGLRGAYSAMPRGRGWPLPGRRPVSVRFGAPLRLRPEENAKQLTDRVRLSVSRLCVEDASTWWESISGAAPQTGGASPAAPANEVAKWRRVWAAGAPVEHEAPLAADPWAADR
ncbi:MAG TPA: lysophospholipid acyltransferase family protein [Frankiaceae bacterium]|jgi:1-acyl-sn-glycerol-3-phosphate acyltransferase|nr:lysophospholipid acyltransferase family protein [Frankiaceae bacterium]